MTYAYLSIGGFLLGSFLYTGWYTTRTEPEVRHGYLIVGAGISLSVFLDAWLTFRRPEPVPYRLATLAAYAVVALGLLLIVRERRNERH